MKLSVELTAEEVEIIIKEHLAMKFESVIKLETITRLKSPKHFEDSPEFELAGIKAEVEL